MILDGQELQQQQQQQPPKNKKKKRNRKKNKKNKNKQMTISATQDDVTAVDGCLSCDQHQHVEDELKSAVAADQFSEFNFWKVPLPDVDDLLRNLQM